MAVSGNPVAVGGAATGTAGYLAIVIQWAATNFLNIGMSTEAAIGFAGLMTPVLMWWYNRMGIQLPNGSSTPAATTVP